MATSWRFLGARAAARAGEDAQRVLRGLAVKSVERELGAVAEQEIGAPAEIESLLTSGLVVRGPVGIAPGLPVIAQWFAAQALLLGEVEVEQLLAVPDDIDLWLYPLAIAVATGSQERGAALLEPMIRSLPGFAFTVIDEALGSVGFDEAVAPPWRESGEQMRAALQAMADGRGDLSPLALPLNQDHVLLPLAVASHGSGVSWAIWDGEEPRDPVHAMPSEPSAFNVFPGYNVSGGGEIGRGSSWAWRWARERLRHGLKPLFDHQMLPARANGVIAEERTWSLASAFASGAGLYTEPLELAPLLERLDAIIAHARNVGADPDLALIRIGGETVNAAAARELLSAAHGRHARLEYPHPRHDLQPGMGAHGIVSLYSDQRLIEHVTSVWEKAIRAYEELVEAGFTAVSNRLAHYVTLPARYVGFITPNRGQEAAGPGGLPLLSGYFEPLPLREPSRVELQLSDLGWRIPFGPEAMDQFRRLRPQAVRWSGAPGGSRVLSLSGRTPSTNLAYEWLWQDLSSTRMVTGTRPGAGRYR